MKIRTYFVVAILLILFPLTAFTEEVYFYHTDNFGTPMVMTDINGEVVWRSDELPFGEEYEPPIESPIKNNRRYLGKEMDEETGFIYMGSRYLNPATGQFNRPDPVGLVDPATGKVNQEMLLNPQRMNRYAYGLNNPYRYVDPDGEFAVTLTILVGYEGYIAASALAAGIAYYGAPIAADTGKWIRSALWNENTVSKNPDFVGQPDGTMVDVKSTPKGSYDQPGGGRTDVLQGEDHGAGQSHTHDPITHTNPTTGKKFVNGKTQPGRSVSAKDVNNIKSGTAKKSNPKKR